MVPSARRVPRDRGRTIVMIAHIAGIPVEEWLMPFIISAGRARWHARHVRFVAELDGPAKWSSI